MNLCQRTTETTVPAVFVYYICNPPFCQGDHKYRLSFYSHNSPVWLVKLSDKDPPTMNPIVEWGFVLGDSGPPHHLGSHWNWILFIYVGEFSHVLAHKWTHTHMGGVDFSIQTSNGHKINACIFTHGSWMCFVCFPWIEMISKCGIFHIWNDKWRY